MAFEKTTRDPQKLKEEWDRIDPGIKDLVIKRRMKVLTDHIERSMCPPLSYDDPPWFNPWYRETFGVL